MMCKSTMHLRVLHLDNNRLAGYPQQSIDIALSNARDTLYLECRQPRDGLQHLRLYGHGTRNRLAYPSGTSPPWASVTGMRAARMLPEESGRASAEARLWFNAGGSSA